MKNIAIILIPLAFLFACNTTNSVEFTKNTTDSKVSLKLITDSSFLYTANSPKGAAFSEKGTFILQDSFLIIDFKNSEFSYECYDIPLNKDTFLIVTYNKSIYLFPVAHKFDNKIAFSYSDITRSLVKLYNTGLIETVDDVKFLHTPRLTFESVFGERKYKITKDLDAKLTK